MISLTETQIKDELGALTFQNGRIYQIQGSVIALQVSEDGTQLKGHVQGSQEKAYKVAIKIIVKNSKQPFVFIDGSCTCPMKFNCKHVAATLLEAHQRFHSLTNEAEVATSQTQHIETLLQKITSNHTVSKNSDFDRWLKTINLEPSAEPNITTPNTDYQLLYILKNNAYHTSLNIELLVAKKLKKGGYGQTYTPFSYTANTHFRALQPIDFDILHRLEVSKIMINFYSHALYQSVYQIKTDEIPSILKDILKTGRCYWHHHQNREPLQLGPESKGAFSWDIADDGKQTLICNLNHQKIMILPLLPLWYLDTNHNLCGLLATALEPKLIQSLIYSPPLAPHNVSTLETLLKKHLRKEPSLPLPHKFTSTDLKNLSPKPKLTLFGHHTDDIDFYKTYKKNCTLPLGRISFIYQDIEVQISNPTKVEYVNQQSQHLYIITRNLSAEKEYIQYLMQHNIPIFSEKYPYVTIKNLEPFDLLVAPLDNNTEQENFLYKTVPTLKQAGWNVVVDQSFPVQLMIAVDDWYTEVHETTEFDWFNMEVGFILDGQKINILPLLVALIEKHPEVFTEKYLNTLNSESLELKLPDNQKIRIPAIRIKGILATLTELYDTKSLDKSGFLGVSRLRAAQLLELEKVMSVTKMRWLGGERLVQLSNSLSNFTGIKPIEIPLQFKGQLRDYQKTGVNWLNFLREFRLGGILSDDMGLGKTIQTLAHLLIEKQSGRMNKPCLIVAPTSLMENWRSESEKFTPSLKILVLQGQDRKDFFYNIEKSDIILTTYPLIVRDKDILLEHDYYMVILDEAQFIKNANTKAYAIFQQIRTDHRLCLTGTPMENHLGELWSLFNFLAPGLLGESKQFTHIFRTPIEKQGNITRRLSLNQRLKPYLLRRTKEEVVLELPHKTEIIHKIILEEEQRDLYESIRIAMESKVQKAIHAKGFSGSQIVILDALLKLRQTCCDPRLLKLEQAKKIKHSAKLSFLMDMLSELIAENKKILLFSSFTSMLTLIEAALQEQKMTYVKLTGRTIDRKTPIQQFQNGEVSIFLISLKAGGTGLNLTAADTVIHYDPWWNPAAEAQATDRAHRIGQTKPVFVYKLVTTGTVEEKILKMQDKKRALLQSLFDENQDTKAGKISADDLKYLFESIDALEN